MPDRNDNGTTHILGYLHHQDTWQGQVMMYRPGEYQPNALQPGNNFQILLNAIVYTTTPASMNTTTLKQQVQRFYNILWNAQDKTAIPSILHEDFRFRGSLGQEKHGHQGFADYVDMVHHALGDYQCIIETLVTETPHVFAKMRFTGIHRAPFLGHAPTHQRLTWAGAALFTFHGERIHEAWVLGDLKGLEIQLRKGAQS